MGLPLTPPVDPQLARAADALPDEPGWWFEPKWDGFRAIAFVDGDHVHLQSRNGRPLGRYFPELRFPPGRYVLDGEVVIPVVDGGEDFEALQSRIHPAASRVAALAAEIPARYVAFDLLAEDDAVLLALPFSTRRDRLEAMDREPVMLTPGVREAAAAGGWMATGEGVVAKRLDAPYRPGERHGMVKVKRRRTLDAVVMGYRPGTVAGTVGSIALGLYAPDGALRPVGHASGFRAAERRALTDRLAPLASGVMSSGPPSRWSGGRDEMPWVALRPELVVEVAYDHVSGGRIRHGARVLRWRDDRDPAGCGVDQLG